MTDNTREYIRSLEATIAAHEATIAELRKAGQAAASRACGIGQVPSERYQREHYPIFWGDA